MELLSFQKVRKEPWNKGKIVGQKSPLKLNEIWAIRVRLQMKRNFRELARYCQLEGESVRLMG